MDDVCTWGFRRVIPCHLANDVAATPQIFRRAFDFLDEVGSSNVGAEGTKAAAGAGAAAGPPASPPAGLFDQAFALFNPASLLDAASGGARGGAPQLVAGDFALLAKASQILTVVGVIGPPVAGQLARRD